MITKTSARRETDKKMHTGHFYFAKNRTFLLCVDTILFFLLHSILSSGKTSVVERAKCETICSEAGRASVI